MQRGAGGMTTSIFLRGLAIVYLIAFASLVPQILGLVGSHGILPATSYLDEVHRQFGYEGYWILPTLAWIDSSDTSLLTICWSGILLSIVLFIGWMPIPAVAGLWLLYLSVVNAGQDFLSFQWDVLLLETGFAALLIAPAGFRPKYDKPMPSLPHWALRILAFRLMLESGLAKLRSGDPAWRNLTALHYHYETQPLPTPPAWYAHHLPDAMQRASVAGMFFIELMVPFFFLVPYRRLRIAAASLTIFFQLLIAATGNYTFFNLLTILLCVPLFAAGVSFQFKRNIATAVAGLLIVVGASQIVVRSPLTIVDETIDLWHVVNSYGLFAVMTTTRTEIEIEGSDDGNEWKAYEFKFKPGDLHQRPRWVAPYQPRLDWQMWFAALSNYQNTPWFSQFMLRLLQASPDVLSLMKTNPFPHHPPRFVRASVYDYRFTDRTSHAATGDWWTRVPLGIYFPPVSLR